MLTDEGFGPASERRLTIEERVIKIEESEAHGLSIAGGIADLLDGPGS